MATATLNEPIISLVKSSFPDASLDSSTDAGKATATLFPDAQYTESEKAEIDQWVIESSHVASPSEDAAKTTARLSSLNTHLASRTTILGSKPSIADIAMYNRLAPVVSKWSLEERTGEHGYHHIVRYIDFVQNSPIYHLKLAEEERVKIDPSDVKFVLKPVDVKAEKDRKKREKGFAGSSAPASGTVTPGTPTGVAELIAEIQFKKIKKNLGDLTAESSGTDTPVLAGQSREGRKKEKKEKQPKSQKNSPAPEKPLSPALIDLRVGHILKAVQHPNADSLYVSTIAVGDPAGTENTTEFEGQVCRTVCSGLNGLIPLEEMQGRKVVTVCNLKPVTMRGIKSCAMVLAASPRIAEGEDNHKGPVELVKPPVDAKAGERVYFEGWEGDPEPVLNPKKKVWETCQPGFTTTENLEVGFDVTAVPQLSEQGKSKLAKLRTKEGLCMVTTLKGGTVR
jgi:aminoacyl tRNA synthase complex-interacting multifunctional protein 1